MPRPARFYNLTRPKLRQSWNKHNLYNLFRAVGREPPIKGRPTFFQQKWAAKSKTRAYHGEHIPEKKWVRLFSRRLLSAVDLSPKYLAAYDGSEQAAGRGSGLSTCDVTAERFSNVPQPSTENPQDRLPPRIGLVNKLISEQFAKITPYMQMTYAPLERRLDTAVFRALFASSVRQARQFVVHGAVKVNGKKMVHPAYQLNPGDMFQVDVEKVLYGTGEQKKTSESSRLRANLEARKKRADAIYQQRLVKMTKQPREGAESGKTNTADASSPSPRPESENAQTVDEGFSSPQPESLSEEEQWKMDNKTIRFLLRDVKTLLTEKTSDFTAKDKKTLRLFKADALRFFARPEDSDMDAQDLIQELQVRMKSHELLRRKFDKILKKYGDGTKDKAVSEDAPEQHSRTREIEKGLSGLSEELKEKAIQIMGSTQLSKEEMRRLGTLLQRDEENPVDDSKPYATPWRPRPYMAAFAFVPRYLEVNPNICAAVYLRHPVARKGLAEVPTPFSYLTNQLSHNWYLGRG
ncbi:hypothetical protein CDD83_1973 [Cordyceps sp. RAO-2017]|nr:hypothetical protein CDD83_1973 [Cordyceps sp. RAO-2017]